MILKCLIIYSSILISIVYGNFPRKIYGGDRILIYKYPYIVSIQFTNEFMCGGVIISTNYILTAASCVLAELNVIYGNLQVVSGIDELTDEPSKYSSREIHQVSHVAYHDLYNPHDNWINDIAILKLQTPVMLTKGAHLLLTHPRSTKSNTFGWAVNTINHKVSKYLQRLTVITIASYHCYVKYYRGFNLFDEQHCFFPALPSSGLSLGDGGYPVMYGRQIQGIVSVDSLDINQPVIYTRIFKYIKWINTMKRKI